VYNAYIDDPEDFPKFPTQLGCQGFVVLDSEGCFATLRSPSLNKVGVKAFEYVERVLEHLVEPVSVEAPAGEEEGGEEEEKRRSNGNGVSSNEEAVEVKAVFSRNACGEEPQELDIAAGGEQKFELPSVGHEGMDAEHKDLEELMQKACSSLKAEDVQVLSKMFAEHAKEEEELMERSSFGDSGVKSLRMFSAIGSHTADHADIVEMADAVIASADEEGLVPRTELFGLCRRIVEHATAFDSRYAGKLIEGKKRKAVVAAG